MMNWQRNAKQVALALALGLALSGCAGIFTDPARIPPGTPAQQIVATLGQPSARYTLPGGGQRLQYAYAGYRVYNIDLDAQGSAVRAEQAFNETLFARRIAPGHWTLDDALREYGPPMRKMAAHNFDGQIWVWRYHDIIAGPRLLYIDVDRGGIVRSYSTVDERLLFGRGYP